MKAFAVIERDISGSKGDPHNERSLRKRAAKVENE